MVGENWTVDEEGSDSKKSRDTEGEASRGTTCLLNWWKSGTRCILLLWDQHRTKLVDLLSLIIRLLFFPIVFFYFMSSAWINFFVPIYLFPISQDAPNFNRFLIHVMCVSNFMIYLFPIITSRVLIDFCPVFLDFCGQ